MGAFVRRLGGKLPFGLGGDSTVPLTYQRRHYLTAAAFILVVALLAPVLFPDNASLHLANLWLIYLIAGVGFYFMFGLAGRFAFCQTLLMAIGGYTTAFFAFRYGFWAGLVAALVVSVVLMTVLGIMLRHVEEFYFAIATLALTNIGIEILQNWPGFAGNSATQLDIPPITFLGQRLSTESAAFWAILGFVALTLLLGIFIERSPIRRQTLAARDRRIAAEMAGVNVRGLQLTLFVFGSVLGAVSGAVLGAWQGVLTPEVFGIDLAVGLFVMVIIGGSESIWGVIIGSAIVVFLPNELQALQEYQSLIYGAILLFGVILMPQGVAGLGDTLRTRFFARQPEPPSEKDADRALEAATRRAHQGATLQVAHSNGSAAEGAAPLLEVREVSVAFGGVIAVDRVSLKLTRSGEVLGLIGPNGSGKTTLLNAICGIVPYTGGVLVHGKQVPGGPRHVSAAGISRTFQAPQIFTSLTCLENALVGSADRDFTGLAGAWIARPQMWRHERERWEKAAEALDRVGLLQYRETPSKLLTYGQQRLLELARSVISDPEVLVLDEPSAGLNKVETDNLADLLEELATGGLTILLVEHKIDFVDRLCNRVVALETGRLIAEGTPSEVWESPQVAEAYLGRRELAVG